MLVVSGKNIGSQAVVKVCSRVEMNILQSLNFENKYRFSAERNFLKHINSGKRFLKAVYGLMVFNP